MSPIVEEGGDQAKRRRRAKRSVKAKLKKKKKKRKKQTNRCGVLRRFVSCDHSAAAVVVRMLRARLQVGPS
jgi:hypothetical protein